MKSIYTTQDLLTIGHLRNLLVHEGIACEVKTPFLAAAKGDLPVTDCWSQLWIVNEQDAPRALAVIDAALARGAEAQIPWKCPECAEEVEGQFGACWRCGSARPEGNA